MTRMKTGMGRRVGNPTKPRTQRALKRNSHNADHPPRTRVGVPRRWGAVASKPAQRWAASSAVAGRKPRPHSEVPRHTLRGAGTPRTLRGLTPEALQHPTPAGAGREASWGGPSFPLGRDRAPPTPSPPDPLYDVHLPTTLPPRKEFLLRLLKRTYFWPKVRWMVVSRRKGGPGVGVGWGVTTLGEATGARSAARHPGVCSSFCEPTGAPAGRLGRATAAWP